MAKYDAIISGYVSMDRVIRINTPAKIGFTSIVNNSDNSKIYYGGCSTNIAYLLARLNKKSLPVIRLGNDDVEEIGFLKYIKDAGVVTDAVSIIENETTSNCYMISDKDKNHITIFYPGAMDGKYSKPLDKEYFENSSLAILTIGSYQDNVEFFNKCKETNTPLVFGMKSDFEGFPIPLLKEILLYSEIIFTNEVEREEIERIFELSSITDLFEQGNAKVIVTTLGKDGSEYYEKTKDGIKSGKTDAILVNPAVDTTGCGDAFIAGFIYAYLNDKCIEDCSKFASVLSSFIIEKAGCITNSPNEEEFLKRYKGINKI